MKQRHELQRDRRFGNVNKAARKVPAASFRGKMISVVSTAVSPSLAAITEKYTTPESRSMIQEVGMGYSTNNMEAASMMRVKL